MTLALALSAVLALGIQESTGSKPSEETILQLSNRCGHEIDWCEEWSVAADRARESGKPILVLFRTLAGYDLPDTALSGPFMDPGLVELVQERFVALRFDSRKQAPFRRTESYGIGPMGFGTSILVATPDGDVTDDTFAMNAGYLYGFLAEAAERLDPTAGSDGEDALQQARRLLRRGLLEQARDALGSRGDAESSRVRAVVERRLGNLRAAHDHLLAAIHGGAERADVACERAELLLRLEDVEAAEETLAEVPSDHADAPRADVSRIAIALHRSQVAECVRLCEDLVEQHPESRWAWQAASVLRYGALLPLLAGRSLAGASEEDLSALVRSPFERTRTPALRPAIDDARRFLLRTQCADGCWLDAGSAIGGTPRTRSPLTVAVTALCARALLPYPEAEATIHRALEFLAEARKQTIELGDPAGVMDYTVWSKPTLILFLADAIDHGIADTADWEPVILDLLDELAAKQKDGGGWTYYQGNQIQSLDPNLNVSFSFVTAYALLAMATARDLGIAIDEDVAERAADCLERMYNPDGSTEYSLFHAAENAPRNPMPAGAAGRGPLCALALAAFGRAGEEEVVAALDRFVLHRASYAREQGKTVMHCGVEGQGSHYLMFDYLYAAEACRALGSNCSTVHCDAVVDQIRGARLANGAYLDNPLIGDRFGASMGLRGLQLMLGAGATSH